jgi:hypothetical protein
MGEGGKTGPGDEGIRRIELRSSSPTGVEG